MMLKNNLSSTSARIPEAENFTMEELRLSEKGRVGGEIDGSGVNKSFCRSLFSFTKGEISSSALPVTNETPRPIKPFPIASTSSSKHCSLRDKCSFKRFRRNNRCKYCRRLLGTPPSIVVSKSPKALSPPPQTPFLARKNTRRPFESTLDEVAWACGRLWCSVGRRKRRRRSETRQRKQINEAFSTLREILPAAAQTEHEDSAAAKVSTLRLAASYIQALSDLLRDTHLTDISTKGVEVDEGNHPLQRSHEKSLPSVSTPQMGSPQANKMHSTIKKTDKKISLVKSLSGPEASLECV